MHHEVVYDIDLQVWQHVLQSAHVLLLLYFEYLIQSAVPIRWPHLPQLVLCKLVVDSPVFVSFHPRRYEKMCFQKVAIFSELGLRLLVARRDNIGASNCERLVIIDVIVIRCLVYLIL